MVFGLIPLLVVGPVLIILLAVHLADESAPVRAATSHATATVKRSGLGDDHRGIELTWTDSGGTQHTSTVHSARPSTVAPGSQVTVRYQPDDPGTIFVTGDDTTSRLADLTFGILLSVLLVAGVVALSAIHVARRRIAERRPATLAAGLVRAVPVRDHPAGLAAGRGRRPDLVGLGALGSGAGDARAWREGAGARPSGAATG